MMDKISEIPVFGFARQTSKIINRTAELKVLKEVMRPTDDESPRLLLVRGAGGSGKTRLLLEAARRAGNPNAGMFANNGSSEKWDFSDKIIVANLLDFTDIRLHLFEDFIERLYKALSYHKEVHFEAYEAASREYRNRRKSHVDYTAVKNAAKRVRKAFWGEYEDLAQKYRIIWVLDTAEQLRFTWPQWLENFLEDDDFDFLTGRQIINLLNTPENDQIHNTTVIIAGRPSADRFFEELKESPYLYRPELLEISYFKDEEHTKAYLRQLADDFSEFTNKKEDGKEDEKEDHFFVKRLRAIAEGTDGQIDPRVLHKYSGGQPIRLSLFIDVLMESNNEPEILHDSWKEAAQKEDTELKKIQTEIEEEFIDIIFRRVGDLRSHILLALVRARYGLTVEQLIKVVDTKQQEKVKEIFKEKNVLSLPNMSFIKKGANNRWILQDEIYNLYDKAFSQKKDDIDDERKSRRKLYQVILNDTRAALEVKREQQRENYKEDKDSLLWGSPALALDKTFRYVDDEEEEERLESAERIFELELERLHYLLRANFPKGMQETFEIKKALRLGGVIEQAMLARVEIWKFVYYEEKEEHWREFVDIPEKPLDNNFWQEIGAFIQATEASDIAASFFFRKTYKRAVEFVQAVNKAVEQKTIEDEAVLRWLQQPLLKEEREHWRIFAEVYMAPKTAGQHIATLEKMVDTLKTLETQDAGNSESIIQRLAYLRGNVYNTLGYFHVTQGEYREAVENYKKALIVWRKDKDKDEEALTRTNLARALSELGLITRAERIARDALELKEDLLFEQQIAYSHNTLALIYNNGLQPENAWIEAATGVAYFRKLGDDRGLGLAYFHLAESLRRLALSEKAKQDSPRKLLAVSEQAIKGAAELFSKLDEPLRKIEVDIEMGSLYRDYISYYKDNSRSNGGRTTKEEKQKALIKKYSNLAEKTFQRAISRADKDGYKHLKLDAMVDLAWVYFYAGETDKAKKQIEDSLDFVKEAKPYSILKFKKDPPDPDDIEANWFMRLAKIYGLNAQIEMSEFVVSVESEDKEDSKALKASAESYVLALGYNELYSPRSPFIPIIFGKLYDKLRKFNIDELEKFNKYQFDATKDYRIEKIKYKKLIDVSSFLEDSFGITKPEKTDTGA